MSSDDNRNGSGDNPDGQQLKDYKQWMIESGQYNEEVLITDGPLRTEVAKAFVSFIGGDSIIDLEEDSSQTYAHNLQILRSSRDRTVHGDYHRHAGPDSFMITAGEYSGASLVSGAGKGSYHEVVGGGVHQHALVEAESIVGGSYSGNFVGPFLRLTAFADFMSWGGWVEVDAARVDTAHMSIRAYMGYGHIAQSRAMYAHHIFDHWKTRVEQMGSLTDNHSQAVVTGGPAGYTENNV